MPVLSNISRNVLWIGFFGLILIAWWMMYAMAMDMDLDILGRPGEMGKRMQAMDPRMPMYMPMANFGPLFGMWAAMMAAMMLPTFVPTMRAYNDLITRANGITSTSRFFLADLGGSKQLTYGNNATTKRSVKKKTRRQATQSLSTNPNGL